MTSKTYYQLIKELAQSNGLKVTDLLALSPKNDPFYAGTATDIAMAQWFADVWQAAGYTNGVHLRRVHYWCVSQADLKTHKGERYLNTDRAWGYLVQASKMARYLRLVNIEDIADNKNPPLASRVVYSAAAGLSFELGIPDLDEPEIKAYGRYIQDAQPYHLEVWVEKSTMNDILVPLCGRYYANLATFEGEVSITACYEAAQRIKNAGKPARVFYISDFDPAGMSIPVAMARKVEYMLKYCGMDKEADVKIKPIALTASQVDEYDIPRTPIKESEKRADKFESAFGVGAAELDALEALHPGVLGQLVEDELKTYYSEHAAREVRHKVDQMYSALRTAIRAVTDEYQDEIEALAGMQKELRAIDIDLKPYQTERYPAAQKEGDDWLFDSARAYSDQIVAYKKHKGLWAGEGGADE